MTQILPEFAPMGLLGFGPIPYPDVLEVSSPLMTDLKPLRHVIRRKLADGRLPTNGITRVWGGLGNDETCDGCSGTITKGQFVMNGIGVEGSRQPLQLHVACFRLWDEERSALENQASGLVGYSVA